MDVPQIFFKQARKYLGVSVDSNTLLLWVKNGTIQFVRNGTQKSHRYYNVREYLKQHGSSDKE